MRKEISFLVIAAIIALGIIIVYYWGGQPTGFFVFDEYENQTACEDAGYVWENLTAQNCTAIVDCTLCVVGCKTNCTECIDVVIGECVENITLSENYCEDANYTWWETTEQNCTDIVNCTLCVVGCKTNCTSCETIIISGRCTGDVCDSDNLNLCVETNCTEAGGHWYDGSCQESVPSLTCVPSWNCSTWTPEICPSSETQTKTCKDLENCGVEKRVENRTCTYTQAPMPSLNADNIENLKLNPGASSEIAWNVINSGKVFLSSCSFEASGDYAEWISFAGDGITDIGIGNTANFNFSVNVPEEIEEGEYALSVIVRCSQVYVSKQFVLQVETKKLEFDLIAADRTRLDKVRIIYSLGELTGEAQDVALKFLLIGAGAEEVAFIEENRSLKANATKEFTANMPINESLEGELELVINYNSEIYSSSVREPIVLGAPIGGAAIFEDIGTGEIAIIVIVLVSLVLALFVVKKIRSSGKTLKTLFQRKKEV